MSSSKNLVMGNLAEQCAYTSLQPDTAAAVLVRAETLRAMILSIPADQRAPVFALVRDLLPASLFEKSKAPHRGGEVLNNIFELFKREPTVERGTADVVQELAKVGVAAEPQSVRNALNYLNSRRIVQRVGYGRYRMEDGSIVEGPP